MFDSKNKTRMSLEEKYSIKFGKIEKVLNSCKTRIQLIKAYDWATDFIKRSETLEISKNSFITCKTVIDYFAFENEIISLIYERNWENMYKN